MEHVLCVAVSCVVCNRHKVTCCQVTCVKMSSDSYQRTLFFCSLWRSGLRAV